MGKLYKNGVGAVAWFDPLIYDKSEFFSYVFKLNLKGCTAQVNYDMKLYSNLFKEM